MSKYEQFINQYPVSKTLCFRLIPQGATERFVQERQLIETDQVRADEYAQVKKMIDSYHKAFIEKTLQQLHLDRLEEYAELYFQKDKTREDYQKLDDLAAAMRKQISALFMSQEEFAHMFNKDMITKLLPPFVSAEEAEIVHHFDRFTIYFTGFHQNRYNLYTGEGKVTEIASRIIDQNLPKYLDNCKSGKYVLEHLDQEVVDKFADEFTDCLNVDVFNIFEIDSFNMFLSQRGIDLYNQILGGYTVESGKKVKGYNEYINEFNQVSREVKLPRLKPLFKQILSDHSTLSFIPDKFESDDQVLSAINNFCNRINEETGLSGRDAGSKMVAMMKKLNGSYDHDHIYIGSGAGVNDLSSGMFGDWNTLQRGLYDIYDAEHTEKEKASAKYAENRKKYFKNIKSYSLRDLQRVATIGNIKNKVTPDIAEYIGKKADDLWLNVLTAYKGAEQLIRNPYTARKSLPNNNAAIGMVKTLLDSMMDLLHFAKPLMGSGKEDTKDEVFYGDFAPLYEQFSELVRLYDKVRNYITAKPYSLEKVKLNFNNGDFLGGWSQRIEKKGAMLMEKDGKFYMMIFEDKLSEDKQACLMNPEAENKAELLAYNYQKPDMKNVPRMFIRTRSNPPKFSPAIDELNLPVNDILDLYDKGMFKREYAKIDPVGQREALAKLIDYFKLGFMRHPSYANFVFHWKDSTEYESIDKFYRDCIVSCYRIDRKPMDYDYLMKLVEEGSVYLFQIYNKDFAEKAHGRENLHTMYFRMLFDERNLAKTCFMLNGGAEMFYRSPSIKPEDAIRHPANQPIKNKNPLNPKETSTYSYEIVKDRRFLTPQYELHIATTLNYSYEGSERINLKVRQEIRKEEETYVVGIDRGERNLLYVCVVDGKGKIVEQKSLDCITVSRDGTEYRTDYNKLLAAREAERMQARQSWTTINNISNLKEGYISQAVNEICKLAVKYDAVIAMEDLDTGFKNSRVKIEKQTYQKLEKMLIDRLNFYADKSKAPEEIGGILNAYQLTEKFTSFAMMGRQNGFIFYMPAWMTSRVDPVTGFVNLLYPRYENMAKAKEFFNSFDSISYDSDRGFYVFDTDLDKFPKTDASPRRKWKLATFGNRAREDKGSSSGKWTYHMVDLTREFTALFEKYGIDTEQENLIPQIVSQTEAQFYKDLVQLTSLMLQMQNYIPEINEEFLISPAMDDNGEFFFSATADDTLPKNAAANGAYNIARKTQWALEQIRKAEEGQEMKATISPKNTDWLAYIQKQ